MFLNLSRIRTPHEHYEKTYEPAAFAVEDQPFRVVEPAVLAFDIEKDGARFRLAGSLRTALQLACSRCLESFTMPVNAAFDLRYQPRTSNAGEGEREIQEDDLSTAYYDDESIDLGQLMREQCYLAVPMKPLCREECLGLCPVCGTNLNRGACSCRRDWEDPRLAVLKKLRTPTDH